MEPVDVISYVKELDSDIVDETMRQDLINRCALLTSLKREKQDEGIENFILYPNKLESDGVLIKDKSLFLSHKLDGALNQRLDEAKEAEGIKELEHFIHSFKKFSVARRAFLKN